MATYDAITVAEIDTDSPITQPLLTKMRDNPIAIAEGDPTAPLTAFPTVLIGTLNTTSGATQTISSLDLTFYRRLIAVLDGISHSGSNANFTFAGKTIALNVGAGADTFGMIEVDLGTGVMVSATGIDGSNAPAHYIHNTSISQSTTSIAVSTSTGTWDAGSIKFYGVK